MMKSAELRAMEVVHGYVPNPLNIDVSAKNEMVTIKLNHRGIDISIEMSPQEASALSALLRHSSMILDAEKAERLS